VRCKTHEHSEEKNKVNIFHTLRFGFVNLQNTIKFDAKSMLKIRVIGRNMALNKKRLLPTCY